MNSLGIKPSFVFKQGDSFSFVASLTGTDGLPLNVAANKVKSQIRKEDGTLIDSLVITAGASTGLYNVNGQNTQNYPIGEFYVDFKIEVDGKIISTPTIKIEVQKSITQW